ncbi:MAG: zinc-binding alcohol dehydrogenase [Chloroflexi bacterium]|nr:zinc-binding alcohol dehydrogenase [Chloroflexota bacterium]
MPRELIAVGPRTPAFRQYEEEPLGMGEIRVRTLFGAPKHGTELRLYRGEAPQQDSRWDPAWHIFLPGTAEGHGFPRRLGNMAVGLVTEVGPGVEGVAVGDRVAGYGPLRETQRWAWNVPGAPPRAWKMPEQMSWQAAVCLDPTIVALGGIRDGAVRVGDRVAVFGLGAIGLMAIQLARLAGASLVVAVDPIPTRRAVAQATGADLVLDPRAVDAGLEIKRAMGGAGVDVAIESSGTAPALHHAVRGLAFGGTVAIIAHCDEFRGGIDLGREAHQNRPTFIFTRAESEPHRDHPRWDRRRQVDTAWNLLTAGRLDCQPLVQPIVPFDEATTAFKEIDEHPERSVKMGVRF